MRLQHFVSNTPATREVPNVFQPSAMPTIAPGLASLGSSLTQLAEREQNILHTGEINTAKTTMSTGIDALRSAYQSGEITLDGYEAGVHDLYKNVDSAITTEVASKTVGPLLEAAREGELLEVKNLRRLEVVAFGRNAYYDQLQVLKNAFMTAVSKQDRDNIFEEIKNGDQVMVDERMFDLMGQAKRLDEIKFEINQGAAEIAIKNDPSAAYEAIYNNEYDLDSDQRNALLIKATGAIKTLETETNQNDYVIYMNANAAINAGYSVDVDALPFIGSKSEMFKNLLNADKRQYSENRENRSYMLEQRAKSESREKEIELAEIQEGNWINRDDELTTELMNPPDKRKPLAPLLVQYREQWINQELNYSQYRSLQTKILKQLIDESASQYENEKDRSTYVLGRLCQDGIANQKMIDSAFEVGTITESKALSFSLTLKNAKKEEAVLLLKVQAMQAVKSKKGNFDYKDEATQALVQLEHQTEASKITGLPPGEQGRNLGEIANNRNTVPEDGKALIREANGEDPFSETVKNDPARQQAAFESQMKAISYYATLNPAQQDQIPNSDKNYVVPMVNLLDVPGMIDIKDYSNRVRKVSALVHERITQPQFAMNAKETMVTTAEFKKEVDKKLKQDGHYRYMSPVERIDAIGRAREYYLGSPLFTIDDAIKSAVVSLSPYYGTTHVGCKKGFFFGTKNSITPELVYGLSADEINERVMNSFKEEGIPIKSPKDFILEGIPEISDPRLLRKGQTPSFYVLVWNDKLDSYTLLTKGGIPVPWRPTLEDE